MEMFGIPSRGMIGMVLRKSQQLLFLPLHLLCSAVPRDTWPARDYLDCNLLVSVLTTQFELYQDLFGDFGAYNWLLVEFQVRMVPQVLKPNPDELTWTLWR